MKDRLFEDVFKKTEKQTGNSTKHGMSSHLEKVFTDRLKFPVNKITFVRYYEKYIEKNTNISNNPSSDLLNKISEYIGYENYEDYVTKHSFNKEHGIEEKTLNSSMNASNKFRDIRFIPILKKKGVAISLLILMSIIIFISFYPMNKQRWMVWEKNHYVEVDFNENTYSLGKLKLYNKERLVNFKEIEVDCNTVFFDDHGVAKIWYVKNSKNELEYFTSYGLHPESNKALNPMTLYMIKKYVCENY